jgi:hypothetical protein
MRGGCLEKNSKARKSKNQARPPQSPFTAKKQKEIRQQSQHTLKGALMRRLVYVCGSSELQKRI